MTSALATLRVLIFVLLSLAAILWWIAAARQRISPGYVIPPLALILHAALFFGVRIFLPDLILPANLNLWSSIIYLHASFSAIGAAIILMTGDKPR